MHHCAGRRHVAGRLHLPLLLATYGTTREEGELEVVRESVELPGRMASAPARPVIQQTKKAPMISVASRNFFMTGRELLCVRAEYMVEKKDQKKRTETKKNL